MVKEFHDQVWVLAKLLEVRARLELLGVAADVLADLQPQLTQLQLLT